MKKILTITTILLSIIRISAQCDNTGIESTYDEFNKSTKNEIKILLQNKKNEQLGIDMYYYSTPLTQSGKITPAINFSARLLNEGLNSIDVGNNPYIHFLFEDGTTSRLYGSEHIGHIFKSYIWTKSFDERSSERLKVLNELKIKTLKAIRFNRAYDDFDFYLSEGEKITFKKIINCITNIEYDFNQE